MNRLPSTLVCLLLLLVTACSTTTTPSPPPQPTIERWTGAAADLRMRWSADPGIDLLTGPAVIIRAYLESFDLANLMGNPEYVYPGFDRAVTPTGLHTVELLPDPYSTPQHPPVGTDYAHILGIEQTGQDLVVLVCQYSYAIASSLAGDEVLVHRRSNSGASVKRITMVAPADESPLPPQKGPLAAPVDDVFGDWQVTGARLGLHTSDWPSRDTDLDACIDRAPDPLERREYLMTGERTRADYPTLPPHPGWPMAPS